MHHPNEGTLVAFTEGRLNEVEIDAVAEHLEICERCQRRVEKIEERVPSILVRLREGDGNSHRLSEACEAKLLRIGWSASDDSEGGRNPDHQEHPTKPAPTGISDPLANTVLGTNPVKETDTVLWKTEAPLVSAHSPVSTGLTFNKTDGREYGYGERFGDYEILDEIGRGGMGVVYRARQISLNRTVALKMILNSRLATDDLVRRFQAEAEAAARLNHPGIVPVFEIGQTNGQYYFSMGLIENGSLNDLLVGGPLPPRRAAKLISSVARTVQFAHSRNIVHRDLKPANVLLDERGNPKLTDFGLAKDTEKDSQLTSEGMVIGTPSYMAPEQASGRSAEIGPLSDVYSLGAILFCLVTNRPPFSESNVHETLRAVTHQEPPSPRQFNEKVDIDVSTICLKCLEKDPVRRYASAAELADDIDHYVRGEPIEARPISRWERINRWCWRNPRTVWGTLLTVFVMIGAVIYAATGLEREIGLFQETLDDVAQRSLRETADWVASATEHELREKFRQVQTAAATPELQRCLADLVHDEATYAEVKSELARHDAAALNGLPKEGLPLPEILRPIQSWISADEVWESGGVAPHKGHLGPKLQEYDSQEAFENVLAWWVCGPDGYQIARDPWMAFNTRRFWFRSYFTGLDADLEEDAPHQITWKQGDGPRMSAVFLTRETRYWVLAISAPVWDNGRFVGVVGMFLGLGSLLERQEYKEENPAQENGTVRYAVLLDPRTNDRVAKVIEHPFHSHPSASMNGRLRDDVATVTVTRDQWEASVAEDPFGHRNFGAAEVYGGRWRTAWAPVTIPDGSSNELIALMREPEQLVSGPSQRLRVNLRWLGLAIIGLFVLPLIPLVLSLPKRRQRTGHAGEHTQKL